VGFGWLADPIDKRYVLAGALTSLAVGSLIFLLINITALFSAFLLFVPLGLGGSATLRGAILREWFGREAFGQVIGMIVGIGMIGSVLGPLIAGWVFDISGSYKGVWFAFGGLAAFGAAVVSCLHPAKNDVRLSEEPTR